MPGVRGQRPGRGTQLGRRSELKANAPWNCLEIPTRPLDPSIRPSYYRECYMEGIVWRLYTRQIISEWERSGLIRHFMLLSILIFVAWIVCYFVAGRANCQTGMSIPTDVVVYRSIDRILHFPFSWLPHDWYHAPNIIGGPGVYKKWYLIFVAVFWGSLVYALFPSIRRFGTKGRREPR